MVDVNEEVQKSIHIMNAKFVQKLKCLKVERDKKQKKK